MWTLCCNAGKVGGNGCKKLTCPYKWSEETPVFCVSSPDARAGCWIRILKVQMSRPAAAFWTISANANKREFLSRSLHFKVTSELYILRLWNSSPHVQMWHGGLNAATQSPSQPWLLLSTHPDCWSHWPAGGTGQTARCYIPSYLSKDHTRAWWKIHIDDVTSTKNDFKTHTLMSSLCHEGTVEQLDQGVLLFIFCISKSKTWGYFKANSSGDARGRHQHITYFPLAASWNASSSQSSSLWENSLTSWKRHIPESFVSFSVCYVLVLCSLMYTGLLKGHLIDLKISFFPSRYCLPQRMEPVQVYDYLLYDHRAVLRQDQRMTRWLQHQLCQQHQLRSGWFPSWSLAI